MTTVEATVALHHAINLIVAERVVSGSTVKYLWSLTALVLTRKNPIAFPVAASVDVLPIVRLLDPNLAGVFGTLQREIVSHTPLLSALHLDL
jgi:hypothetical protein